MAERSVGDRLIGWYGGIVEKNLAPRPRFTREWLMTGFRLQRAKVNLVPFKNLQPAGNYAYATFMNAIVGALDDPAHAAITSIFTPCEVFHALGAKPMCAEAVASFASGAQAEGAFLSAAEAQGTPETFCSYHRLLLGMASTGMVAPPRMLASCSVACDANNITFKALARAWGIPHAYIDVPYDVSEDSMRYVAGQLREMAKVAEEQFGARLSEEALVAACRLSAEADQALLRTLPARRGRYLANTMTVEMMKMLDATLLLGTERARHLAELMLADLAQAPRFGGTNLVWAHVSPYFLGSIGEIIDCSQRAQIVASDMMFTHMPPEEGLTFGPEQPFEFMAERLVRNCFNGPTQRRIDCIRQLAEATGADAVVLFCHWGCKQTAGSAQLIRHALEDAGYPVLVLDGDACDRANCMEGQMSTRFSAFMEMVEAQRGEASDARDIR